MNKDIFIKRCKELYDIKRNSLYDVIEKDILTQLNEVKSEKYENNIEYFGELIVKTSINSANRTLDFACAYFEELLIEALFDEDKS